MKDHEGYLSKGWMMHEPYNLHNGTPALAIYTYLYRTTRKNKWQGSLQTLADLVEIPIKTIRTNLRRLQSRNLVTIEPLAHSHYSIKALRLTENDSATSSTLDICEPMLDIKKPVVDICEPKEDICEPHIKYNNKYNINIKQTNSSSSIEAVPPPSPPADEVILDRKVYIARVLSRSLPEYPYAVVYEYAGMVNIPSVVVDDFITHYASTGWKMNNGGRVENWAAALMNWHKRAQRFAARDAAKSAATRTMISYQAGQMSPQNRAIYEQEQERKRRQRELEKQHDQDAITYSEYIKMKNKSSN